MIDATYPAKVSVCTITYNHERFIAQAVQSALEQKTDFPFEIVIGEDCSTDRTRSILTDLAAQHPGRIRLLQRDHNLGMGRNFSETYGQCRGQYIALLEGDDYWTDPLKLQKQVDALDAHPDWTICFHRVLFRHEARDQPDFTFPGVSPGDVTTIDDLFARNFIQTCSVVYRRVIADLPGWLAKLKLGDWPLHLLHADRGKIGFLPAQMAVYRVHQQGVWSHLDAATRYRAVLEMLTAVDEHFEGRYRAQVERARLQLITDERDSVDYRLGRSLLAPLRRCRDVLRRIRARSHD